MPQAHGPRKRPPVILHFHTYKNAGTTVDAVLKRCFPGAWANFDGPVPEFFIHHSEIANIAINRPHLKAISSHQIRLPNPNVPGIEFLPIVFIRRPELRVASIWRFESRRTDDNPDTVFARQRGFRDWLAQSLQKRVAHSVSNSQSFLFSFSHDRRPYRSDGGIFERAKHNLAAVPFVGVVEHFDESMRIFSRLYSPQVPEFQFEGVEAQNVSAAEDRSIEEQLAAIEDEIGTDLFRELHARNAEDIALHDSALLKLSSLALADRLAVRPSSLGATSAGIASQL